MPIRIREVGNINVLDIDGRIDINSSDLIETIGWLTNTGKVNIILNLENVDLVDYSGLSVLAIAYKNIMNHKGKLKFLSVPLCVVELFKLVKLDIVFETYTDEESAVNSFYGHEVDRLTLRRRFKRLDINLTVKYKLGGDQKKPKLFEGKVLNISASGLYIFTPYIFPLNSVIDMQFIIPNIRTDLEATGRVLWHGDKEIQPHSYPGMGVAFSHLTGDKEKAIVDFIDKNVTHRADQL